MKIALAISSFRQDDAVCALLDEVHRTLPDFFSEILVLESLGDGGIEKHVVENNYPVQVINKPENIGSAGNLAERLTWASARDIDWVYAVNHDGEVKRTTLNAFRNAASNYPNAGALYPLRIVPTRKKIDVTGVRSLPLPFLGVKSAEQLQPYTEVRWGSSNGAFYNLAPVRTGLLPERDLWMGWEDLQYGWTLHDNGWKQYIVRDAEFIDDREYLTKEIFRKKITISDKPSWYAYYFARNFVLIAKKPERKMIERAVISGRIGLEAVLTTLFKPDASQRLKFIALGVLDGLKQRTGKWRLP